MPVQPLGKDPPQLPFPVFDPSLSIVTWAMRGKRRQLLKENQRRYIAMYLGPAAELASEAARMAGYKRPGEMGKSLERRLQHAIAAEREARRAVFIMSPEETLARLCFSARCGDVSAQKAVAQIHGLLESKLTLNLDREQLTREIREALRELKQSADIVDAQLLGPRTLPTLSQSR